MEQDQDQQTFQIIGAALEVHSVLGPEHRDVVYRTALVEELKERGIPVTPNVDLSFEYKGKQLPCLYIPFTLICFDEILVEVKTVPKLLAEDESDLLADLEERSLKRGLILNFARKRVEIRRVTWPPPAPPPAPAPPPPKFKPHGGRKPFHKRRP